MKTFIISVLAGIMASFIAVFVFPRVRLSKRLCQSSTDEKTFTAKVVNLSLTPLTDVSINFYLCYRLRDNTIRRVLVGCVSQNEMPFIEKCSKENEEYAVLLDFHLLDNQMEDFKNEKAYVQMKFTAKHSVSRTPVFKKESYTYSNSIPGLFEHGKSTNIVAFR